MLLSIREILASRLEAVPLSKGGRERRRCMLKFVVVLCRRPDLAVEQFLAILRGEHAAMAEQLPALRKYVQNHVRPDPNRRHPGWDAAVELSWDDWEAMEAAWATPEVQGATAHLGAFVDLSRSSWSVVQEEVRR